MTKRIRVISNGHGEDMIAVKLINALDSEYLNFLPCPLVGMGNAYRQIGLTPVFEQKDMPSGGFLRNPVDVTKDILAGLFKQTFKQWGALNKLDADFQIVVGDVFALVIATLKNNIPTIFFPTAKSERAIPHLKIELMLIKKLAKHVFPRDQETHLVMLKYGISSCYFGNIMFDKMQSNLGQYDSNIVGLLPGSRHEAIANIETMLDVISKLTLDHPKTFVFSLSPHFRLSDLSAAVKNLPWRIQSTSDDEFVFEYTRSPLTVKVLYNFMDVLHQSSVFIGLAGTANEQVMFAKRSLISFIGNGPQSTKRRFMEQFKLIEGASTFFIDSNDSGVIASEVSKIFNSIEFKWSPLNATYQNISDSIANTINDLMYVS